MAFLPNYVKRLSSDDLKRYELKVLACGGVDPFEMSVKDLREDSVVPDVTREDVVDYLVLKTDFYTLTQLKNYKALEAHNYITSGHVKYCVTCPLGSDKAIAFGKVTHSQSLNEPPLKCWILFRINGEVITGHCNCMAGSGDVCSHVGAILFFIELMAKKKRNTTCTSQPNAWLQPARKSSMCMVQDSDLRAAGTKWKELSAGSDGVPRPNKRQRPPKAINDEEVNDFMRQVRSKGINSALLRVWDGLQLSQGDTSVTPPPLPALLRSLFCGNYAQLPLTELTDHCERVFSSIKISKEEAINLEKLTRGQLKNKAWMDHRAGRITASRMKDVCRNISGTGGTGRMLGREEDDCGMIRVECFDRASPCWL